jgi:hypothetical protein
VPKRSRVPVGVAGVITVAAVLAAQGGPLAHRSSRSGRTGHAAPVTARAGHGTLVTARPAADTEPRVTTVEFWAGRLPGGAHGRWLCRRTAVPGRPPKADGTLVVGRRRQPTGDCGHVPGATVGGTWWRAPAGRWYFIAAASPRFAVRVVPPPASRYRPPSAREGMMAVPGPRGGARPRVRMTVTARRVRAAD